MIRGWSDVYTNAHTHTHVYVHTYTNVYTHANKHTLNTQHTHAHNAYTIHACQTVLPGDSAEKNQTRNACAPRMCAVRRHHCKKMPQITWPQSCRRARPLARRHAPTLRLYTPWLRCVLSLVGGTCQNKTLEHDVFSSHLRVVRVQTVLREFEEW